MQAKVGGDFLPTLLANQRWIETRDDGGSILRVEWGGDCSRIGILCINLGSSSEFWQDGSYSLPYNSAVATLLKSFVSGLSSVRSKAKTTKRYRLENPRLRCIRKMNQTDGYCWTSSSATKFPATISTSMSCGSGNWMSCYIYFMSLHVHSQWLQTERWGNTIIPSRHPEFLTIKPVILWHTTILEVS